MNTNEFIQKPVRQLFFHYLIPAICGTMVTSIYVLADTIFIGKRLGATALAALNISLPIYNIFFGLGLLSGVGGSVLMSICRGKSQKEEGNTYFTTALLLNFALLLISMTVCVLFMEDIAWLLGGTEETILTSWTIFLILSGEWELISFLLFFRLSSAMTVHQNLP